MKPIFLILLMINLSVLSIQAKTTSSKILSENEINKIFTGKVKKIQGIRFPIFKIYSYIDKTGESYLVLTENKYKKNIKKPLSDRIEGFCFKSAGNKLVLLWKMKDFIKKESSKSAEESAIWFWTKYFDLKDFDNDGMIDPVLVYGTYGINNFDDGRIKILIYYKGKKTGVRHQNGVLDFERNTQIDKSFYQLPAQIQNHVKTIMERMTNNDQAIFPAGYKEKMSRV